MSDLSSIASSHSNKSDEELNLEERIGFKPDGTNNFLCTVYNEDTGMRKIMFDGAMPLHEFAPLLYEFIYIYINKSRDKEVYMLSVITYESDAINIAILDGNKNVNVKKKAAASIVTKLLYTFDNVFGLFVLPDGKRGFIPGRKYRLQMSFTDLQNSYKTYKLLKNKIKELVKTDSIPGETDSEDSDGEIVNSS